MLSLLVGVVMAASDHIERCRVSLEPALRACNEDSNCRCGVLAKAGAQCLKDAPPGSLIDLIKSIDDGNCLSTQFMDKSVLELLESNSLGHTVEFSEFYNFTSEPEVLQEMQDREDARDEELANAFATWIDHHLGSVYERFDVDQSAMVDVSTLWVVMLKRIVGWL